MKSTELNYVNNNNQRNIGKTTEPGTDNCSILYAMCCDNCGYKYFANSTNIYEKKCPKCQEGIDTVATK